ncbi:epoxyqueuosine reductase QueH [Pseudoalteromonas luteoviolacea]
MLLHSCCEPCRGEMTSVMLASKIDFSILLSNSDIHLHKQLKVTKR